MDPRKFLSRTLDAFGRGPHREVPSSVQPGYAPQQNAPELPLASPQGRQARCPGAGIVAPPAQWAKPGTKDAQIQT